MLTRKCVSSLLEFVLPRRPVSLFIFCVTRAVGRKMRLTVERFADDSSAI